MLLHKRIYSIFKNMDVDSDQCPQFNVLAWNEFTSLDRLCSLVTEGEMRNRPGGPCVYEQLCCESNKWATVEINEWRWAQPTADTEAPWTNECGKAENQHYHSAVKVVQLTMFTVIKTSTFSLLSWFKAELSDFLCTRLQPAMWHQHFSAWVILLYTTLCLYSAEFQGEILFFFCTTVMTAVVISSFADSDFI